MKKYELLKDLPFGYKKGSIFYKDEEGDWCIASIANKIIVGDYIIIRILNDVDILINFGWFKLLNESECELKMKVIAEKYGVDFGNDNEKEVKEFFREKGYGSLADLISKPKTKIEKINYSRFFSWSIHY